MSACERCWRDAGGNAEEYSKLIQHRNATLQVCTMEDQAGWPESTWCDRCGRQTVHVYTKQCVNLSCCKIGEMDDNCK